MKAKGLEKSPGSIEPREDGIESRRCTSDGSYRRSRPAGDIGSLASDFNIQPALPKARCALVARTRTKCLISAGSGKFRRSVTGFWARDRSPAIRDGVPVSYRDSRGQLHTERARVIDFQDLTVNGVPNNRFLAVRELKIQGLRSPAYNRRADLVCFVNGLPLVFIELKAVYKNIRHGYDGNLRDYMDEHVIAHAFHHNAFLIVSNGHRARYGSSPASGSISPNGSGSMSRTKAAWKRRCC